MRHALALSLLLAATTAVPCFADELSFRDLGPWVGDKSSHQARMGDHDRHQDRNDSVPKTGTASFSGITVGKADLTPSTTNITAHDGLTGTMSLDVNFGTRALEGRFDNLTAIDPKTHSRTSIGTLFITNPFTPISGKSYTAIVSTFSVFKPVGGQLSGKFFGPGASLTSGNWQASGKIPETPTPTSFTTVSMHAGFIAAQK